MGESVANFIAKLHLLVKYCNFGSFLEEMLHDCIVCGIQDETIKRKLLAENKLPLTRATEIVLAMQMSTRDASNIRSKKNTAVKEWRNQYKTREIAANGTYLNGTEIAIATAIEITIQENVDLRTLLATHVEKSAISQKFTSLNRKLKKM